MSTFNEIVGRFGRPQPRRRQIMFRAATPGLFRKPGEVSGSDLDGMANVPQQLSPTTLGELVAEFLGSFVIAIFGFGVVAQVVTAGLGAHDSIAWSWGLGVMLGVLVAGKASGAHLNPAVTLAVAVYKGFPWRKVLAYWFAQLLGWFVGALIIRWDYNPTITKMDPNLTFAKTQGIFSTSPGNGAAGTPVTLGDAFLDQIIGTAMLLFLIFAITDVLNSGPTPALSAFLVGLVVVAIGFALGTDAGYAINPARDLGPRLMEFITGYKNAFVFPSGQVYFWVPIVGPLIGGLVGGGLYQITIARTLPEEYTPAKAK